VRHSWDEKRDGASGSPAQKERGKGTGKENDLLETRVSGIGGRPRATRDEHHRSDAQRPQKGSHFLSLAEIKRKGLKKKNTADRKEADQAHEPTERSNMGGIIFR